MIDLALNERAWLLADDWFGRSGFVPTGLLAIMKEDATELAALALSSPAEPVQGMAEFVSKVIKSLNLRVSIEARGILHIPQRGWNDNVRSALQS